MAFTSYRYWTLNPNQSSVNISELSPEKPVISVREPAGNMGLDVESDAGRPSVNTMVNSNSLSPDGEPKLRGNEDAV